MFKAKVAVDAEVGGVGRVAPQQYRHVPLMSHEGSYDTRDSFRANRARLEGWLREGLDVRNASVVSGVKGGREGVNVRFESGEVLDAEYVVAADGVHSTVRKEVLGKVGLEVIPLVAFNGKRRVDRGRWDEVFAPVMEGGNVVEEKCGDAVLSISVGEVEKERVSINWTYSRPPRGAEDALHRPDRSNAEAQKIPEEFFAEIGGLENLSQPFREVYDEKTLRGERILHWLMRKTLAPLSDLQDVLANQRICFIGDAVHAEPIIGGNGANAAILDGIKFAEAIAESGFDGISKTYDDLYPRWQQTNSLLEKNISELHEVSRRDTASL